MPATAGKDLIVQAKTGSGKTLAYMLPFLQQLETMVDPPGTVGLVVAPTRELAVQIVQVVRSVSSLQPPCLIGGASMEQQRQEIARDKRLIVGTPGRILDFLRQREILLRKCRYFVLDEADEMLSMDFLEDVEAILSALPERRQGLFISATITPRVDMLARKFLKDAERIIVETPLEEMPSIEHRFYRVHDEIAAKATALCDILDTTKPRSAIIFCNTKSDTELVEVFLRRRGFDARRINSDLTQAQRNAVMDMIRKGSLRFLVGTDIAARGIDIEQLDAVINYTLPDQPEVYVHRTGRTGRAGRSGIAMSLVGPGDFSSFQELKRHTAVQLQETPLPSEVEVGKARVAHFVEILEKSGSPIIQPRDEFLAKALLQEHGVAPTDPKLVQLVTKLSRFMLEKTFAPDTRALEEEVTGEPAPARRYEDSDQDRRGGGGGYRQRDGGRGRHGGRDSRHRR